MVVTDARINPAAVGFVVSVTVNEVVVALATVPTAPLSKVTELFAAVPSNPNPEMVMVVVLAARLLVVFEVTEGLTVAT